MDKPSPATPPSKAWPDAPTERGRYYGITDKFQSQCIVLSKETFEDIGTEVEQLRKTVNEAGAALKRQHEAIFHLSNANKAQAAELSALQTKHKNLSRAYKKMKRTELEPMFEDTTPAPVPVSFNPLG